MRLDQQNRGSFVLSTFLSFGLFFIWNVALAAPGSQKTTTTTPPSVTQPQQIKTNPSPNNAAPTSTQADGGTKAVESNKTVSTDAKTEKKVEDTKASTKAKTPALPPIGQIIWVKGGSVTAKQPDQAPRVLKRRSVIYEGDVITTSKGATGQAAFTDGGLISFNPESEFKIDEYKFKKGAPAKDAKSVMSLMKGGFRTVTGSIPKENPDAYKINTPVATIGVRGTGYATVLSPTKGLLLKIEKGKIEVANKGGKVEMSSCADEPGSKACNEYGVVKSFDISPVTTNEQPPELANLTPLTPVPKGFGEPGSGGADGDTGGTSGPAKAVSNFCVGLLENLYKHLHNLFG